MGKERVQTRVDPDTNDQIETFAEDNNLSQSEAVRRIIRAGLADQGYPVAAADGGNIDTENLLEKIGSPKAMWLHIGIFAIGTLLFELTYILFQAGHTTLPLATLALGTIALLAATVGVVLATLAQLALGWPIASHVPLLGRYRRDEL